MKLLAKLGLTTTLMTISAAAAAAAVPTTGTVPEPSTWALLAIGAMGVFFANRKK